MDHLVEVSLVGGGQVAVGSLDQVVGEATYALVRDSDGVVRVTEWASAEKLRATIAAKLERPTIVPAEVPPTTPSSGS
jgi:hypothetical protein